VGDSLLLGDASLRIARILTVEPDRGAGFMAFAPRVMIHAADVPATGLVQPASRLTYRLAVAGDTESTIAAYARWARAEVENPAYHGLRVEAMDSGRPEMRRRWSGPRSF
jgi:putative ABC transport system permease protein